VDGEEAIEEWCILKVLSRMTEDVWWEWSDGDEVTKTKWQRRSDGLIRLEVYVIMWHEEDDNVW